MCVKVNWCQHSKPCWIKMAEHFEHKLHDTENVVIYRKFNKYLKCYFKVTNIYWNYVTWAFCGFWLFWVFFCHCLEIRCSFKYVPWEFPFSCWSIWDSQSKAHLCCSQFVCLHMETHAHICNNPANSLYPLRLVNYPLTALKNSSSLKLLMIPWLHACLQI